MPHHADTMDADPIVRLLGHAGRLRRRPDPAAPDVEAGDRVPVWEAAVDGPGLARVLAAALVQDALPCVIGGVPHHARARGCWYDAASGVLVVELREPPRALV